VQNEGLHSLGKHDPAVQEDDLLHLREAAEDLMLSCQNPRFLGLQLYLGCSSWVQI